MAMGLFGVPCFGMWELGSFGRRCFLLVGCARDVGDACFGEVSELCHLSTVFCSFSISAGCRFLRDADVSFWHLG